MKSELIDAIRVYFRREVEAKARDTERFRGFPLSREEWVSLGMLVLIGLVSVAAGEAFDRNELKECSDESG